MQKYYFQTISTLSWIFSLAVSLITFNPKPALSAEKITTFFGPLQISISVDSLEIFAETGTINSDLALITNNLDAATKTNLREILKERFELKPALIYRLTRLPIAEKLLTQLGEIIQIDYGINGYKGLRSAAILAAADQSEGLTIINFLRYFPTQEVYLNLDSLAQLRREIEIFANYRPMVISELIRQSQLEAIENPLTISPVEDFTKSGSESFSRQEIIWEINDSSLGDWGLPTESTLKFDLYLPKNRATPAPLIIIVQGFGASHDTYAYIAEHLASYGYAVASIEHGGSQLSKRREYINTQLGDWITPIEFIRRPLDASHLLDKLEELAQEDLYWSSKINLEQVGVFGYSFGGYTALALAGGAINHQRLVQACNSNHLSIDTSFFLQCNAQYLGEVGNTLKDPRIKAVFSVYPTTSHIFGPEGISQIDIPTVIWASSEDIIVQAVQNQIHPFVWLETPQKYLFIQVPGNHFSTAPDQVIQGLPIKRQKSNDGREAIARKQLQGMTVAFFKVHLEGLEEFTEYLTAAYTETISQSNFAVYLIRSLNSQQLETAYGKTPPIEILPSSLEESKFMGQNSVLEEINRTGVLKVGVRTDSPPLAYLDNHGNWRGECAILINSLKQYLELTLDSSTAIQVVVLPSSPENNYQLVQQGRVHLECGPNLIQSNLPNITFSEPYLTNSDYRIMLPEDDTQWQSLINQFLLNF